MEQDAGVEQGPVAAVELQKPPPPPVNDESKTENDDANVDLPSPPLEDEVEDTKKKKKSGKKSRRSSMTKPSPKPGRKQLNNGANNLDCKSDHKRRSSITQRSGHRQARRFSMGSVDTFDKNPNPETTISLKQDEDCAPNAADGNNREIIDSNSVESFGSPTAPSSLRSFESISSQKSQNRPPSKGSFESHRQSSNRSFDSASLSRPSSFHTANSDLKSPRLGEHFGNTEGKKKEYLSDDFVSDIEDETMCSIDNIQLVIKNVAKDLQIPTSPIRSSEKASFPSGERSQEERKINEAKPRKKRQPKLKKTDEFGRGSSHYKLEGVYVSQRLESNAKKSTKEESNNDNGDVEVLTKPPAESNEKEGRNKTPIKGRMRSRRRGSLGDDGLTSPRSRSRELTSPRSRSRELTSPRSRSKELTSPRSRSRELTSPRSANGELKSPRSRSSELRSPRLRAKGQTRAPKDFTRTTDPLSNDKRIKRGSTANMICPEAKEAVNKIFGTDTTSEEMLSENQNLPTKKPVTESQETAIENRSPIKDASESNKQGTDPLAVFRKKQSRRSSNGRIQENKTEIQSPSEDAAETNKLGTDPLAVFQKKQSRRSSIGRTQENTTEIQSPSEDAAETNKQGTDPLAVFQKKQSRRSSIGRTQENKTEIQSPSQNAEETNKQGTNPIKVFQNKQSRRSSLGRSQENKTEIQSPSKDDQEANNQKTFQKKQGRRSSMGKNMKKERTSTQPEDAANGLLVLGPPLSQEILITSKSSQQESLEEAESIPSEKPVDESLGDTNQASKPVTQPSKNLEKRERRRSSTARSMKKEPMDVEKELAELCSASTEESKNIIYPEQEVSEDKDPSPAIDLNENEKKEENGEKLSNKIDSQAEDVPKKPRRRNSKGKILKKEKSLARITSKSSHKLPKKSSRGKKSQAPTLDVESSTELTRPSAVEGFASGSGEFEEIPNHGARDATKNSNGVEKVSKKDRPSRRSSTKEMKNLEKDSPVEASPQVDLKSKNDPASATKTNGLESTNASSTKELISEQLNGTKELMTIQLNDMKEVSDDALFVPGSLHEYISSHHSKRETQSICTDTGSFFSASMASDGSEEKDEDTGGDANYLQLTFVTEHGTDGNNLFALMDEKLNRSFAELDGPETEERNSTLRSFVSFTDEIDLKVSTTSYSLSQAPRAKLTDDISTDDCYSADEDFPYNDTEFAPDFVNEYGNATWNDEPIKVKKSIRKKLSPFGLSKSLHDISGLHHDNGLTDLSPRRRKRGMLQKMKTGIAKGGRQTLQKAASTRNILEQATTKVLSRRKEEGRGLLRNDSD